MNQTKMIESLCQIVEDLYNDSSNVSELNRLSQCFDKWSEKFSEKAEEIREATQ